MGIPFLKRKENGSGDASEQGALFRSADPMFAEQFKTLCSRLQYRADVLNFKVVAVTSAVAGEGKTLSSVNIATNLAAGGRKNVLLLDVDLRKPDLARGLKIPARPGLAEYLSGSANLTDIVRKAVAPGLCVIPGGMRVATPWDLLVGERFRELLTEVRERYGLVLLDAPPIIPVSDAMALRELVDGFILLYRLGFTPHPLFRQVLEDIGEKKLLGVVLNAVEPQPERYYRRYYGKYYTKQETP
jgi:protein-tyrosine kinase